MNFKILNLKPGDRIIVPKSGFRIVQHHAVYLGKNYQGQDLIAENKIGFGVRLVTADEFFRDVIEITQIIRFTGTAFERKLTVQKALSKLGLPYNLINYNCQHFANEIIHDRVESEQVNNFMAGAKMVGGFFLLIAIANIFSNND